MSSAAQHTTDGRGAVPVAVMVFVVLDFGSSAIATLFGGAGLGRVGLLTTAQMFLVVLAVAATLFHRPRTAVLLSVVVAVLALSVNATGGEISVMVVTAMTAAVRADRWQLGLVTAAEIGYIACFGVRAEHLHDGWGRGVFLSLSGVAALALAGGLVARRLLRARDRRRTRVQRLERENAEIRAAERARLADDLQTVVTRGLATIEQQLDTAARRPGDLNSLRRGLAQVDDESRALLTQLRTLLEILRRDTADNDVPTVPRGPASRRWVERLTTRQVRVAAAAVLALVAVNALLSNLGSALDADVVVLVLGCLACAAALWRPFLGAGTAVAALVVSAALGATGYWDALSTALLCMLGALAFGLRRLWVVLVPIAAYGGLLAATAPVDRAGRLLILWYPGFAAVVVGLAARHLMGARAESERRLDDLATERGRGAAEERSAVARELHDVVAHQLSVTTMLVMATSLSDDAGTLGMTLDKVRRTTEAANHELSTLLHTMRAQDAAGPGDAPLASPLVSARALGMQLVENGHYPVMDIDPRADDLDVTTQRTLVRVLQEATTNILRYAPRASVCRCSLAVDDTGVRLSVVSPLSATVQRSDLSLGWGLRGIRERVELTRGTFTAGPHQGRWQLTVTLPAAEEPPGTRPRTSPHASGGRLVGALTMETRPVAQSSGSLSRRRCRTDGPPGP